MGKIINLSDEHNLLELALPATNTSTLTGSAVNLLGYQGDLEITLHSAAGTGTNPTLNGKIQDSADGSTGWADVSGATFTEIDDTAGGSLQKIGLDTRSCKQYIRFIGTIAGTTPSFIFGVSALGQKQIM